MILAVRDPPSRAPSKSGDDYVSPSRLNLWLKCGPRLLPYVAGLMVVRCKSKNQTGYLLVQRSKRDV